MNKSKTLFGGISNGHACNRVSGEPSANWKNVHLFADVPNVMVESWSFPQIQWLCEVWRYSELFIWQAGASPSLADLRYQILLDYNIIYRHKSKDVILISLRLEFK